MEETTRWPRKIQIFNDPLGRRNVVYNPTELSMQNQRMGNWNNAISTYNNPGESRGEWTYEVLGIDRLVDMTASSRLTTINLPQDEYNPLTTSSFHISRNSVVPESTPGLQAIDMLKFEFTT